MKNLLRKRVSSLALVATSVMFSAGASAATVLYQSDFDDGTYQITQPGTYRLGEDISFNPHPVGSVNDDDVELDAYTAGRPFPSQYGATEDGKYDPAAFGIGFFAAIAVSAKNVTIDLNGHTIEQHPEHALLQRFFAVIELADQPFVPDQGPSDFGDELVAAKNVTIKNGTIGRSSHHGIHGNGNKNVTIRNVDFVDFEVAAVALNGVKNLTIMNSTAANREDVPVIGTFSNARFISAYVDWLVQSETGSDTTLTVQGNTLTAAEIQQALRDSINNVFEDVITDGLGFIDPVQHPLEYRLYHNKHGIVDGNAYGYLVNPLGVAVNGFPVQPEEPAKNITIKEVHILSQRAFINEVIALKQNGGAVIDPVGAVFMVRNTHPDTGDPVTVSSSNDSEATYIGNPLANAQALVAKADLDDEFEFPEFLDTTRLNITEAVLDWIENGETLDKLVLTDDDYLCNGDTMFHVNKGVIGFKMDGARNVTLKDTSASNLVNLGEAGSEVCGDYAISHPKATLEGYGGAVVRGYSFAGTRNAMLKDSEVVNMSAAAGSVTGVDIITDSRRISLKDVSVDNLEAGLGFVSNGGPNEEPDAVGVKVGAEATQVNIKNLDVHDLDAFDETADVVYLTP